MDTTDRKIFVIGVILLIIVSAIIISNKPETKPPTPKKELKIQKNIDEPVKPDTITAMSNPWPIRVKSVEKSYEKNTPKWQVIAENGVMYYTNKKPKVGDIAFYLNDNDEITDRNGNRMERTR